MKRAARMLTLTPDLFEQLKHLNALTGRHYALQDLVNLIEVVMQK